MKIKKITITVSPSKDGLGTNTQIEIETKNPNDNIRGVEAIKVLSEAINLILQEIV